jgi:uncharacterized protein YrrD
MNSEYQLATSSVVNGFIGGRLSSFLFENSNLWKYLANNFHLVLVCSIISIHDNKSLINSKSKQLLLKHQSYLSVISFKNSKVFQKDP